jgi:hypothetical protein
MKLSSLKQVLNCPFPKCGATLFVIFTKLWIGLGPVFAGLLKGSGGERGKVRDCNRGLGPVFEYIICLNPIAYSTYFFWAKKLLLMS